MLLDAADFLEGIHIDFVMRSNSPQHGGERGRPAFTEKLLAIAEHVRSGLEIIRCDLACQQEAEASVAGPGRAAASPKLQQTSSERPTACTEAMKQRTPPVFPIVLVCA